MVAQTTLKLDPSLLLFTGNVRHVYRHPLHPERCIKILQRPERARSVNREVRYLLRYLRQGKDLSHICRCHGWQRTNLGSGSVFDLVFDYHGGISATLADHVKGQAEGELSPVQISQTLEGLREYLFDQAIIVCDPAPHNIAVQWLTAERFQLVLVDGIGNPHFIKIADYLPRFARVQIAKKWRLYVEENPLMCATLREGGYRPATLA